MIDENVLVVPTSTLWQHVPLFQGSTADLTGLHDVLKSDLGYLGRKLAETDPTHKQIIPYVVARTSDRRYLCYQRTNKSGEKRLHGNWSIGIGGHMNDGDADYETAVQREIGEEVHGLPLQEMRIAGLLNDDSNDVGKVHFGIVHLMEMDAPVPVKPGESALDNMDWKTMAQLLKLPLENWSLLSLLMLEGKTPEDFLGPF